MTTHDPLDTVNRIVTQTANRGRGDAAPAIALLDGAVRRPDSYPVLVPVARDRDYAKTLPSSLADLPKGVSLGPALDGTVTGGRVRRRKHRERHPDQYLAPTQARAESIRALLCAAVDSAAAALVESVVEDDQPADTTLAAKSRVSYADAEDMVLRATENAAPQARPSRFPGAISTQMWWTDVVEPVVEDLPGARTVNTAKAHADRKNPAYWALELTEAALAEVRGGVLDAASVSPVLADALDLDDSTTADVALSRVGLDSDPKAKPDPVATDGGTSKQEKE